MWRARRGRESLPEGQEGLGGSPEEPEQWVGHPGGQGGVRGPSKWAGSGREALSEDWEWLGWVGWTFWGAEVLRGSPGGPGGVGRPYRRARRGQKALLEG